MPGPFDRFNDRAKRVLALAQDEAIRFNHNYIGVEHLLLGLMREGEGAAARALDALGVDLAKIRTAVERPREQTVQLATPLSVYVLYRTAWVEADGSVHFRPLWFGCATKTGAKLRPIIVLSPIA